MTTTTQRSLEDGMAAVFDLELNDHADETDDDAIEIDDQVRGVSMLSFAS
jgi:hypothetical protein